MARDRIADHGDTGFDIYGQARHSRGRGRHRGYLEDGLCVEEFEDFGPVQLFKSAFTTSWNLVLNIIKEQR